MKTLLTAPQVSKIFQIHLQSLYRLIYQKRIPFIRVSGMIRFDSDDLEKWVQEGKVDPKVGI